jgi:LysM repeat protein
MESPSPTFITPISSNQSAISTATPRSTESIEATPTDLVSETDTCTYVIQRGDTLYRIALAHNLTVDEVVAANPGINPSLIIPGDELVIPDCEPDAEATPEAAGENITTVGSPGEVIHTVVAGETLLEIAKQYGVTIASIVDANNLADPNRLSVGQELIIPPPESP